MQSMFLVPLAILHKLELSLHIPSILLSCIISSVALGAFECNLLYSTFLFTSHINITPLSF